MNSLASATAISSGLLRAKRQVRAAEYVQPVPWVFWSVSVEPDIRGKGSAVVEDTGCGPSPVPSFHHDASRPQAHDALGHLLDGANTGSVQPVSARASGRLGVTTVAGSTTRRWMPCS